MTTRVTYPRGAVGRKAAVQASTLAMMQRLDRMQPVPMQTRSATAVVTFADPHRL